MEPAERAVRKFVVDSFLENGSAPSLEEIAEHQRRSPAEVRRSLRALEEARHLKLLEGTDRILMVFPFSAISTPFRVTRSNGRRYFANCAWDAIAFHAMLSEPIRIDSFCHVCARALRFRVSEGRGVVIDRPLPRIRLALPAAEWWKDITRTCANTMVFLGEEEPAPVGDRSAPAPPGLLTVEQVAALSVPIYATKLREDHERPPVSVLRETFGRLGLVGPHWTI